MKTWHKPNGQKVVSMKKNAVMPDDCTEEAPEVLASDLKEEKLIEIKNNTNTEIEKYVTLYCQAERDSWVTQVSEAEAYILDNTADTPFIDNMCTQGVVKEELITSILTNKAQFDNILSIFLGQRVVKSDTIKAIEADETLTNQEKLDAINEVDTNISLG
jgi:hypothetical protein